MIIGFHFGFWIFDHNDSEPGSEFQTFSSTTSFDTLFTSIGNCIVACYCSACMATSTPASSSSPAWGRREEEDQNFGIDALAHPHHSSNNNNDRNTSGLRYSSSSFSPPKDASNNSSWMTGGGGASVTDDDEDDELMPLHSDFTVPTSNALHSLSLIHI